MAVAYYQKPEALWGYEHVTSAYKEEPKASAGRIFARAKELFGGRQRTSGRSHGAGMSEAQLDAALRKVLK